MNIPFAEPYLLCSCKDLSWTLFQSDLTLFIIDDDLFNFVSLFV